MCTLLVCSIITYLFTFFPPDTLVPRVLKAKFSYLKLGQGHFPIPIPLSPICGSWRGRLHPGTIRGELHRETRLSEKKNPHFNHFYVTMIDQFLKFCFSYLNLWGKPWPFKLCFVARFPILWIIGCFVLMFIGFASVSLFDVFQSHCIIFFLGSYCLF